MSCIPKHALPMNVKHTQDESTSQLREYQFSYKRHIQCIVSYKFPLFNLGSSNNA